MYINIFDFFLDFADFHDLEARTVLRKLQILMNSPLVRDISSYLIRCIMTQMIVTVLRRRRLKMR